MARKTIDQNGEKRGAKITVSMTQAKMEELKLYCDASGKSANDYIVGLIAADLKKNQPVIQEMRSFRNKRFAQSGGDSDEGNG